MKLIKLLFIIIVSAFISFSTKDAKAFGPDSICPGVTLNPPYFNSGFTGGGNKAEVRIDTNIGGYDDWIKQLKVIFVDAHISELYDIVPLKSNNDGIFTGSAMLDSRSLNVEGYYHVNIYGYKNGVKTNICRLQYQVRHTPEIVGSCSLSPKRISTKDKTTLKTYYEKTTYLYQYHEDQKVGGYITLIPGEHSIEIKPHAAGTNWIKIYSSPMFWDLQPLCVLSYEAYSGSDTPPGNPQLASICGSVPGVMGDTNTLRGKCEKCFTNGGAWTALGCISTQPTGPNGFISVLLRFAIGIAGGIAFLLILWGGFQMITSTGNPEALNAARELIGAAIGGLLMIIFSLFLLRLIGFNILGLPGFG